MSLSGFQLLFCIEMPTHSCILFEKPIKEIIDAFFLPPSTGLCLRVKLQRCLPFKHKLEIYISEGTHSTEENINKQINDKERVVAAMENPNLGEIVEQCVLEPD